jgi:hypothetical protein
VFEPDTQSINPDAVKLHLILIAELYVPMLKIIGATAYESGYTQHSNVQFVDEVGVMDALTGLDSQVPVPPKYMDPPFVADDCDTVGSNGDMGRIANVVDAGIAIVCVRLLPELSINRLFCNVSMLVFAIAVNGDVGGVKLAEYSAVPLRKRKLEINPLNTRAAATYAPCLPIVGLAPAAIVLITVAASATPLIQRYAVVLDLLIAI